LASAFSTETRTEPHKKASIAIQSPLGFGLCELAFVLLMPNDDVERHIGQAHHDLDALPAGVDTHKDAGAELGGDGYLACAAEHVKLLLVLLTRLDCAACTHSGGNVGVAPAAQFLRRNQGNQRGGVLRDQKLGTRIRSRCRRWSRQPQ